MAVVGTSFLVDLLADQRGAKAKLDQMIELGEPLWAPAIALHELYYGAGLHERDERETRRIEETEQAILPVEFTAEAAAIAGRIEADAEAHGRRPGRADVQIAATALARGEPLVTRDEWFDTVDGLRVEGY